jgi:hypothetical protein
VNPVGEPSTRLEKLSPVGEVQVPMAAVQAWNITERMVVAVGAVKPKVYVTPEAAGTAVDIVKERDVSWDAYASGPLTIGIDTANVSTAICMNKNSERNGILSDNRFISYLAFLFLCTLYFLMLKLIISINIKSLQQNA